MSEHDLLSTALSAATKRYQAWRTAQRAAGVTDKRLLNVWAYDAAQYRAHLTAPPPDQRQIGEDR